ncbi:helix-turn-helix domain-containing protein [Salmonella enterica]|nr:helix-turn-helix domain-containing protein [Salmonella enterica]EAX0693976.1 helix-turn-helix domain-containing protein [Salmonella enterica]EAX1667807.1 helix-turn-helix domain-containing protein [Salmonella enterica]EAY7915051.1 helix-turn-helix domain-containing protein [Salmonella enterica]EJO8261804.1 helix-turn-helix domain-containing protein [Salmonella enterica]
MNSLYLRTKQSQDYEPILFENKNMNRMNIHDRIKFRMGLLMLKSRHLVDATGASKATVSQWVNGGSEPSAKYIPSLARILKVSERWLLEGGPQMEPHPETGYSNPVRIRDVPLISLEQAATWLEVMEMPFNDEIDLIEVPELVTPFAFAVKMENNSMMDLSGQSLSIPIGAILVTDIGKEVKSGSIVVASIAGQKDAVVKRYIADGPHKYLMSINPNYDKIVFNDQCTIIGVCVKMQMDLI